MNTAKILTHTFGLMQLAAACAFAYPWKATDFICTNANAIVDYAPGVFEQIEFLPHVIGVCDIICTGEVLSTNDGHSAKLAVDEILWGHLPSTNILIRNVYTHFMNDRISVEPSHRYLVCAFTNNWWGDEFKPNEEKAFIALYEYLSPTSRPPDNAVFGDYRLMSDVGSVIDFDLLEYDGTNYWDATRSFITNFVDLARIQNNPAVAHDRIYEITRSRDLLSRLPKVLRSQLRRYKLWYYERGKSWSDYPPSP